MTAKDVAIDLIDVYVKRGDSIQSLKSGMQGSFSDKGRSSISGYIGNKKYDSNYIVVTRVGKEDINAIFKLADIYDEILQPNKQMALL